MRLGCLIVLSAICLAGCAATNSETIGPRVDQASTTALWISYGSSQLPPLQLAYVEAELVSRGETQFGTSFIGQRTVGALGRNLYDRSSADTSVSNTHNCSDFKASWQAQRFFLDSGGPLNDPHDLDRDGDGLACEWGTDLKRISKKATRPAPVRQTYRSRCYTGPRGGTYTLTASGRKNYSGC